MRYHELVEFLCPMCSSVLLLMFGLLDADPVALPDDPPERSERLDYLRIDHHGDRVVASCQCRRTAPVALLRSDFDRRCKLASSFACPLCTAELKAGSRASSSDPFEAWFNQNKYVLDPNEHLYASALPQRMVDATDGTLMRPRRFIYSRFYGVDLATKDKVLMKCGDANCLNPHHMHIAGSPAKKTNLEIHQAMLKWSKRKMTNQTIQELLEMKFNQSFSGRTISKLRNEPLQSGLIAI